MIGSGCERQGLTANTSARPPVPGHASPLAFNNGGIGRAPRRRQAHEAMRRRPRSLRAVLLALAAIACAAGGTAWTVYHDSLAGTGVAPGVTSVNTATSAWTSPALDGQIYGEPLVFGGRVYV